MKKDFTSKKFLMIFYWLTLISFIVPAFYLLFRIIFSTNMFYGMTVYRSRADYILMFIQCVLGIVVIHIPSMVERRFNFEIPKTLNLFYIIFLYCAIFLGEVRNFYHTFPRWDDILHCMSSVMNGLLGFMLVAILNHDKKIRLNLSPLFVALFAFCFSVSIGALWEIYEFLSDHFLGLNMQKFMLEDGTELIGHLALLDTMVDIIIDGFGALLATIIGYLSIKNKKGWAYSYLSGENTEKQ